MRPGFASGAGGRWHADGGKHGVRCLAETPVVPDPPTVSEHEVDALGAVERAAAAERDDRIDRGPGRDNASGFNHGRGGVGVEVMKAGDGDPGALQAEGRLRHMPGIDEPWIGDEERPLKS